jgi:hypothetical protein
MLRARRNGATFTFVLTIGRQNLHLHEQEAAALCAEFEIDLATSAMPLGVYADAFLGVALGAERVDSMDASEHEDATIIHDLNQPVALTLHESYDAIIDSGSLEHIFNLRRAREHDADGQGRRPSLLPVAREQSVRPWLLPVQPRVRVPGVHGAAWV